MKVIQSGRRPTVKESDLVKNDLDLKKALGDDISNRSTRSDISSENISFNQEQPENYDETQDSESTQLSGATSFCNNVPSNPSLTSNKKVTQTSHIQSGADYIKKLRKDKMCPPKQIRELKRIHGVHNLMPRAPFARLVKETIESRSTFVTKITAEALYALQESAEHYLVTLFEDAARIAAHRKVITVGVQDLELLRYIRGRNDPGSMVF